jgi:hypothetical protein
MTRHEAVDRCWKIHARVAGLTHTDFDAQDLEALEEVIELADTAGATRLTPVTRRTEMTTDHAVAVCGDLRTCLIEEGGLSPDMEPVRAFDHVVDEVRWWRAWIMARPHEANLIAKLRSALEESEQIRLSLLAQLEHRSLSQEVCP